MADTGTLIFNPGNMAVCGGLIREIRVELLALTDEFSALVETLGLIPRAGLGDCAGTISAGLRDSAESLSTQANTLNSAAEVYAAAERRLLEMAMALPADGTLLYPAAPGLADALAVFGETPRRSVVTDTGLILEDWFAQLAYEFPSNGGVAGEA